MPDFENAKVIYLDNQGKIQGNLRISNLADEFIEELEDSQLLEILDQDFMVIIDNYLIKLDFELKIAAVTKDLSEKERLAQRKYDSKSIKLYRFEDDVLQLLEEGKESTITTQELNSRILSTFDPNAATYCTNCDKIK